MDLKRAINDVIDNRLHHVGEMIVDAQQDALSDAGSKDHHSHPGEAPLKQSGRLANSFDYTASNGELQVTTDCEHAKYLMESTSRIAPRDVLAGWHRVKQQVLENMGS